MKSFSEIREAKMPAAKHVFLWSTKVKGISVKVQQSGNKFDAYIDNEKLDTFRDLKTAKAAALEFVKQYKGS